MDLEKLINPGILNLKPYEPGKPVEDLERELGIKNAIKLASNENPMGPSPLALKAVDNILSGLHRYPDGNALRLKEAISNENNVEIEQITVGNGSNDIIEFVVRSFLSTQDQCGLFKTCICSLPTSSSNGRCTRNRSSRKGLGS